MSSDNETVAKVIAAERDHIERAKADAEDLEIECEFTAEEVVCIINRIEAACKREVEYRAIIAGVSLADAVDEAHKREVAELQRRLKVAEDALVKMQSVACAHCDLHGACNEGEDGMVVQCNDMIAINNALAAIRGEGGAK